MEYKNEELGVSFEIDDKLTIDQHLEYKSALLNLGEKKSFYKRLWVAGLSVIKNWKCDIVKAEEDFGDNTDPRAADVAAWVGVTVNSHVSGLSRIPKN